MTSTEGAPSIPEYLIAQGVQVEPVEPGSAGAPEVSIAVPAGWQQVPPGMFPGAYGVWTTPPADGWADNAVLLVAKFSQPVDPRGLLTCAFTDARRLPEWTDQGTDDEDFQGFPSAGITGTYVVTPQTLWAYNRYTIVTHGADQYLVQLTVTIRDDHDGSDAATIIQGLKVS
ncbi:LpqN/LpqT family lipoprotein [Nocardia sp. NPDC020380]|uniref:LpqN/LpqT family lipoprotein n=1 Tax=Nocardia sp. NPDC020380 TaxID=3364309 RepID=UPI00379123FA